MDFAAHTLERWQKSDSLHEFPVYRSKMNAELQKTCTRLYKINQGDLYAFLVRNIRDEAASMDMLQDVFYNFYRVFLNKKLPPNDAECRMYLFKIARNQMINHSRAAYQRKVEIVDDLEVTQKITNLSIGSMENNVLDRMEMQQAELALQALLDTLDEKFRNLILLRYHAKMKLDEIAQIMDTTISTVSRQIKKAEKILHAKAKEAGFEFEPE